MERNFNEKISLEILFNSIFDINREKKKIKGLKRELESIILKDTDKFEISPRVSNSRLLPLTVENYRKQSRYKIVEMFAHATPADVAMKKKDRDNKALKRKVRLTGRNYLQ